MASLLNYRVSGMNDPVIVLAVRAYLSEPVSMAQIARILGIGEKAFSRIVRAYRKGVA